MRYTLTDDPSQCMWHHLRHTVDPESLDRERVGEILVCRSCAPSCAAALRSTLSEENHRRLLESLPPDAPFAADAALLDKRAAVRRDVRDRVTDRLTERPAPPTDPVEADQEAAYWPDW